MSLKFEIKDWRFEITWRELAVTPRARQEAKDKRESRDWLRWQPALISGTLDTTHTTKRNKKQNELD